MNRRVKCKNCYEVSHKKVLNLKPYSTISCDMIVRHDENAAGFVEKY